MLVTADAESHNSPPLDGSPSNAGWEQGLYIGSGRTGWVTSFILALAPPISGGDGGPEGVAVDRYGNIYWGEEGRGMVGCGVDRAGSRTSSSAR